MSEDTTPMRVGFTGSRTWNNAVLVRRILREIAARRPGSTVVVGCARGLDQIVRESALDYGLKLEVHTANWNRYGRSAGMKRNQAMIDSGLDALAAFRIGGTSSRGTTHMIEACKRAGVRTKVFDR